MRCGQGSRSVRLLALLVTLSVAFGCGEEEGGAQVGELVVTLTADGSPEDGFTTSTLTANAEMQHPPDAVVTFGDWIWTVDGAPAGITTQSVDPSSTTRGEVWQVSGVATVDGVPGERAFSQEMTLENSRPLVAVNTAALVPRFSELATAVCVDDDLSIEAAISDADGDPLTLSYTWSVGGVQVSTASVLPASFTAAGDSVTATLTADDGFVTTTALISNHFVTSTPNCPYTPPAPATASPHAASGELDGGEGEGGASAGSRTATTSTALASVPGGGASPLSISETGLCRIDLAGALVCSGVDGVGLDAPPEGRFSQVRVALDYACGLRVADGGIVCWGEPFEDLGQLEPPEGSFVFVDLAAETACGLRTTGEIACWGDPADGGTDAPDGVFVHLDVSDTWACAMAASDEVICWGDVE